jgi:hypothetical protein
VSAEQQRSPASHSLSLSTVIPFAEVDQSFCPLRDANLWRNGKEERKDEIKERRKWKRGCGMEKKSVKGREGKHIPKSELA